MSSDERNHRPTIDAVIVFRGYAFVSDLSFADIAAVVGRGPWTWTERDSESLGDYLWTRVNETNIRVFEDEGHYCLDFKFTGNDPAQFDVLVDTLLTRVLPTIGARDVRPDRDYYS
ncbi:hypothetical protein SAMN05192558_105385 [Actinokineospora alba]|uniref:Uncharacterized protein n=1 Tax=Actinokineospora alba TaxID=504798 RepID=A0A1H0NL35_9PSEU|nr:hypothetical protein C8E96_4320 [Actinokineospora alba]SDH85985.1 hypothetical protein SAMN05421871_102435 [Actinokineospora alba]SDO93258.1 hypothetical protein SAMN05192558_105385 [Actinokineospora alba]